MFFSMVKLMADWQVTSFDEGSLWDKLRVSNIYTSLVLWLPSTSIDDTTLF